MVLNGKDNRIVTSNKCRVVYCLHNILKIKKQCSLWFIITSYNIVIPTLKMLYLERNFGTKSVTMSNNDVFKITSRPAI